VIVGGAGKSGDSPTPVLVRLVISVSFHPLFHHLMIWLHLQLLSPLSLYILRDQASRDDSPHKAWGRNSPRCVMHGVPAAQTKGTLGLWHGEH
jgi:hypothetical protein